MHLYDFITDEIQYDFKSGYPDSAPYELRAKHYLEVFLKHLDKVDNSIPPKYLNKIILGTKDAETWFNDLLRIIKNDQKEIEQLGNAIIEVYTTFLQGHHYIAVTQFVHLLEKFDLLDLAIPESIGAFFRGRYFTPGEKIHEEVFYYHIPFDKRFLIRRQRFSFSGMPLLYAGQSMIAAYFELDAGTLENEKIATCLLGFDHLFNLTYKRDGEMAQSRSKIFDITNSLLEMVNDTFMQLINKGLTIPPIGFGYSPVTLRRAFRKLLLSHLCTFIKTPKSTINIKTGKLEEVKDPYFIDEYVLPQLLMEAIRVHRYDGILYPSTKFYKKKVVIKGDWKTNIYQSNLAMFTQYNPYTDPHSVYDPTLYKNIQVQVEEFNRVDKDIAPPNGKVKSFDAVAGVDRLQKNIDLFRELVEKQVTQNEYANALYLALFNIEKKIQLYKRMEVEDIPYLDTFAGKMEIIYQIQYFKFIRTQFYRIQPGLMDKMF